jgi:hypothetical protein
MAQRYRFTTDDEGHNYLIPAEKTADFDAWLAHQEETWARQGDEFKRVESPYVGEGFEGYRVNGVRSYTFESPLEDA